MVFCRDGSFYTAADQDYEITYWNSSGEKELIFTKEWEKQTGRTRSVEYLYEEYIKQDFMREMWYTFDVFQKAFLEKGPSPLFPPVLDLLVVDESNLLVIRSYDPIEGTAHADYFDKRGLFLGEVTLPKTQIRMFGGLDAMFPRMVMRNGRAASLEMNESEELSLVYYEYQEISKTAILNDGCSYFRLISPSMAMPITPFPQPCRSRPLGAMIPQPGGPLAGQTLCGRAGHRRNIMRSSGS